MPVKQHAAVLFKTHIRNVWLQGIAALNDY